MSIEFSREVVVCKHMSTYVLDSGFLCAFHFMWKSVLSLQVSLLPYLLSPVFPLMQLVLELCRDDGVANLQSIQSLLDKIHTCSTELCSTEQMVKRSYGFPK